MKMPLRHFLTAAAVFSAAPALAQEAPTAPTPTAPAAPPPSSNTTTNSKPHVNLFGMTVTLNGAEAGVVGNLDGRANAFFNTDVSFDTGNPLADLGLDLLSDRVLRAGDRIYSDRFDNLSIEQDIYGVAFSIRPTEDATRFRAPGDANFGARQSIGYIVKDNSQFRLMAGADLGGEGAAVMLGDRNATDRLDWFAAAGVNISGDPYARAQASYRISDAVRGAAFVDTQDGAGARLSYVTNVNDRFRLAAQGTLTTRVGPSVGVEGDYRLNGTMTLTAGGDSARGGRLYGSIRKTF